jgi:fibronectin-binding autotransporter adhesin
MKNKTRNLLLATVSWSLLQLLAVSSAQAAANQTYAVGNTNDSGASSLRAEITTAVGDTGADIVNMSGLSGTNETITLASDLPTTVGTLTSLTIGGSYGGTGHVTISGAGSYKLANVTTGTVNFTEVGLTNGPIVNGGTGISISQSFDSTYNGVISGAGTVTKAGTGALTLTGVNTYTGATTVSAGTLQMSGAGKLAATAVTVSSGATLDINGTTQTIDEIVGAGTISVGAGSLTTSTASNSTFSGTLTGTAASTFAKAGAGTLTLSGTTTGFLGTKTLTGAGGITGPAASVGSVTNTGSTVTFNDTAATTYAGIVSGTGAVILNGVGGNVTVTKAQTYTGGTTLTNGTLTLGVNNALPLDKDVVVNSTLNVNGKSQQVGALTGAGTITLGSGTLAADSGTFTGVISGTGRVVKTGTGTLTLTTGANTYTGGTAVQAGNLTGDTTALQGNINVSNGATLTMQGATGTYAGQLSGAGAFVKAGANNITLSGTSSGFTGTATVSAGTLTVTTSSLPVNIINNSTLAFNQSTNGTFSKVISGTGGVTNAGTGIVTLSGVNTYSGGTTISAGTLAGTVDSIKGNIANSAALIFNQPTDGTYTGVMSSTGTFDKQGAGTLTLSGTNTNTGAATVTAGKLYVTGTIANTTTTVASGAILGGTGTTAAIVNNGSVSVGVDPTTTGHLTMTGNLTNNATGQVHVKLGATTVSDYLDVNSGGAGIATLNAGGKIVVYPNASQTYAAGNTFDVIRTSAAVANPTNVTVVSGNLIPLTMTPSASGNNLRLTVTAVPAPLTSIAGTSTSSAILAGMSNSTTLNSPSNFSPYIVAVNSLSTDAAKVTALENLAGGKRYGAANVTSSAMSGMMKVGKGAVGVSGGAMAALVANASGEAKIEDVQSLLALNSKDVREEVKMESNVDHIKQYVSSANKAKYHRPHFHHGASVWVKGLYDRFDRKNSVANAGYQANTGAMVIGRNMALSPEDKAGFFGGYGQTRVKYKLGKGTTNANHYILGANMTQENGDMPFNYGATIGVTRYSDKRNVVVGAITEVARSKHYSYNLGLQAELAKNCFYGDVLVKPKFGLDLFSQWHEAYKETGSGASLSYKNKVATALEIKPGIEISKLIRQQDTTLIPSAGLTYSYTADIGSRKNRQSIVGQGISFSTIVKNDSKNAIGLNVGLAAKHKEASEFGVKYEGTLRQKATEHQFTLNAEWKL